MLIRKQSVAGGAQDPQIAVSTAVRINPGDARWQAWLVDSATTRAEEGARRLRDRLVAQRALPDSGFVPLAAVAPDVSAER